MTPCAPAVARNVTREVCCDSRLDNNTEEEGDGETPPGPGQPAEGFRRSVSSVAEYRDEALRPGGRAECDERGLLRRRREDGRVPARPVEHHEDRPCEGHEVTRSRGHEVTRCAQSACPGANAPAPKACCVQGWINEGKGAATWEGEVLDLDRDLSLLVVQPRPVRTVVG